jgi:hypothetical protein
MLRETARRHAFAQMARRSDPVLPITILLTYTTADHDHAATARTIWATGRDEPPRPGFGIIRVHRSHSRAAETFHQ